MCEHHSLIIQLHMDFPGFKWLISFCACSFQISIIMFIFLYRLAGGDDHCDQRGKECLKCFCDTFDSDRCMNSLTRRWMSICSRFMIVMAFKYLINFVSIHPSLYYYTCFEKIYWINSINWRKKKLSSAPQIQFLYIYCVSIRLNDFVRCVLVHSVA